MSEIWTSEIWTKFCSVFHTECSDFGHLLLYIDLFIQNWCLIYCNNCQTKTNIYSHFLFRLSRLIIFHWQPRLLWLLTFCKDFFMLYHMSVISFFIGVHFYYSTLKFPSTDIFSIVTWFLVRVESSFSLHIHIRFCLSYYFFHVWKRKGGIWTPAALMPCKCSSPRSRPSLLSLFEFILYFSAGWSQK